MTQKNFVVHNGITVGNIILDVASNSITGANVANIANLNVTNVANLGNISNVRITGGSNGQVLTTDGNGVVSWGNVGNATAIVNGNSSVEIPAANGNIEVIRNGTAHTTFASSGLEVVGNLDANNLIIASNANVGDLLTTTTLSVGGNANVGDQLTVTGTATVGNLVSNGIANVGSLITSTDANVGSNLEVTGWANIGSNITVNADSDLAGNVTVGGDLYTFANVSAEFGTTTLLDLVVTGTSNLGNVANITITGGSNGQILTTNGSGNLSWTSLPSANYAEFSNVANTANSVAGANVSGTVANATFATSAGSANSATVANSANSVAGANVSGQVGNALVAGTVYTNAQSNITSVGTLTGLTSNGTINFTGASNVSLGAVGNVKITGGSNGQVLSTNGSGVLSWATPSSGSTSNIANGTSNINIPTASGNVLISSAGNANIVVVTGDRAIINGQLTVSSTVTLGNSSVPSTLFMGGAGQLTIQSGNINVGNRLDVTGNASVNQSLAINNGNLSVLTGNISATNGNISSKNLTVANGIATLGPVGNVRITGGSNGQILTTNGSGVLSWGSIAPGNVTQTAWTTYIPSWTASTTNPTIGDGTITGRYQRIGGVVSFSVDILMGSTTTFGSGNWRVSLPANAQSNITVICTAVLLDSGTRWYNASAFSAYDGSNSYVTLFEGASPVSSTAPFTWANGDRVVITGTYELA